jgi:dephospho-CoA kinase
MIKIGLTGGIGTGKSVVSEILNEMGAEIISGDLLGHEAYLPDTDGFNKVVAQFGQDIVDSNGHIDRKKLGPIVFSNPENMAKLNLIMHPIIYQMIKENMAKFTSNIDIIVVEAAVLIEANWQDLFDQIWVVSADEEVVIQRLATRNNFTKEEALKRIQSQMPQSERIKYADVVVDNSNTLEDLKGNIKKIWHSKLY